MKRIFQVVALIAIAMLTIGCADKAEADEANAVQCVAICQRAPVQAIVSRVAKCRRVKIVTTIRTKTVTCQRRACLYN